MRVAILEDDPDQAEIVSLWLKAAGCEVFSHDSADSFVRAVRRDSFDLYLLDWVLPELSGLYVLEKLRTELSDRTPVIIATVKDEERSVVRALEAGADDYLVKPIRRNELIARAKAILRRAGNNSSNRQSLDASPYHFDLVSQAAFLYHKAIALTNREFALAVFLFRNQGRVLSRNHLLGAVWGVDGQQVSTRTVDTHISRLRRKLAINKANNWKLSAVYQHGYRIERISADETHDARLGDGDRGL